jgi:hypothetical protein
MTEPDRASDGTFGWMRLHPNPPRLVTVVLALVLGVAGFVLAWPVDQALGYLDTVEKLVAPYGIHLTRELGFLGLFACPTLLAIGSLLPGI